MATDTTNLPQDMNSSESESGAQFEAIQLAQAGSAVEPVQVVIPAGAKVVRVPVIAGEIIELPFGADATLAGKLGDNGNLAIKVGDVTVILEGYTAAEGQQPVTIETAEGTPIVLADVLSAGEGLDIQTAAGGDAVGAQGADNTGAIFEAFGAGQGLGGFNAIGALDATSLNYKLIDADQKLFVENENGDVDTAPVFIESKGGLVNEDDLGVRQIEVDAPSRDAVVTKEVIQDIIEYFCTPFQPQGNDRFDDADKDGAIGDPITGYDDGATDANPDPDPEPTIFDGKVTVDFGADAPGSLRFPAGSAAQMEALGLTSNGHDVHFQQVGDNLLQGYIDDGECHTLVLTVKIVGSVDNPDGTTTFDVLFAIDQNLDHPLPAGGKLADETDLPIQVPLEAVDSDGSVTGGSIEFDVRDDIPFLTGGEYNSYYSGVGYVDEDFLEGGNHDHDGNGNINSGLNGDDAGGSSASGSLAFQVSFGADGPADHPYVLNTITDADLAGIKTSEGNDLHVLSSTGDKIQVVDATNNSIGVFTLTLDSSGNWNFDLLHALQENGGPANTENNLALQFGAKAFDYDGDAVALSITINVDDDMPNVPDQHNDDGTPTSEGGYAIVDEDFLTAGNHDQDLSPGENGDDNGGTTVSGQVNIDYGADGPGSFGLSGIVENDPISSLTNLAGDPVLAHLTTVGSVQTLTGRADGVDIFTLTLDTSTGDWTFTLLQAVKHPDGNFENNILLDFGIAVTDADGNSVSGAIKVSIDDDSVTAHNDTDSVANLQSTDGNVITGAGTNEGLGGLGTDLKGADGAVVTAIHSENVNESGEVGEELAGQYGKLTLNADGSYNYVRNDETPLSATEVFTYTLTDGDGDTDTATLTIKIDDHGPSVYTPSTTAPESQVYEKGLPPHNGLPEGSGEGADSNPNNNSDTSETTPVGTITFTPGDGLTTITIKGVTVANGIDIPGDHGTMHIVNVGAGTVTYTYTLSENVDHSGGPVTDNFPVLVTDADGDPATATVTINIINDVPTAHPDVNAVNSGALLSVPASGVEVNDVFGADGKSGAGVIGVSTGSNAAVPGATTNVGSDLTGSFGTLHLNADGSYTYQANPNVQGVDHFVYTIKDGDGDISTTTLDITVNQVGPRPADSSVTVDEAALDTNALPDGKDLATSTITGSNPTSADETKEGTLGLPAGVTVVGGAQDFVGSHGTLHVNADGTYTYTLTSNVLNPLADDGAQTIPNVETFGLTIKDAGGNTAAATIHVNVIDDVPTISAVVAGNDTLQVDETNLLVDKTTNFSGLFTSNYGADGAGATGYTLNVSAAGVNSGIVDTATGSHVFLFKEGNNIVGHVGSAIGPVSFVVSVNSATGEVTLDQQRAVIHNPDSGPDQETSLISSGVVTLTATITDKDGDSKNASIDLGSAISFKDDAPSVNANAGPVLGSVEEDGMSLQTGDFSEGNKEIGDTNSDDETSGAAGSLTALFNAGADAPLTIGLSTVTSGLPHLLSHGVEVSYAVVGNVLTASANGHDVFTLTLNGNGSWTFDLKDQLDHVVGNGENTALQVVGGGSVNSIDFSSLVTATDADGDKAGALGAGKFTINVVDDIPTANAYAAPVTGLVEEDGMSLSTGDFSEGNKEGGDLNSDDETSGVAGSLTSLFTVGADEPLAIGLATDTSGLPHLLSNGIAVTYAVVGNVLTASAGGHDVFTLTLNSNGSWNFDLKGPLDHVAGNGENTALLLAGGGSANSIDFSSIVTATDADGDKSGALGAGKFSITVVDDAPTAAADTGAVNSGALLSVNAANGVEKNDVFGADGKSGLGVVGVSTGSNTSVAGLAGNVGNDLTGSLGKLHLNADGSYTYQANTNAGGTDHFVYTIKDADGDISTTTLDITVNPVGPTPVASAVTVNEAALDTTKDPSDLAASTITGSNPASPDETKQSSLGLPAEVTVVGGAQDVAGTHGLLHIDADGKYTYTLTSNVLNALANDGVQTINGVETFNFTIKDGDGNTSSAQIKVNVIDDVPSISGIAPGADTLQVDETNLLVDKTTNFAGLFTASYGADGAGATGYTLNVSSAGVDSGIIDTATNSHVFLFKEGNNIVGHIGSAAGAVAFVVSVNSTTGEVTLDQQRAVVHSPNTGPDQETSLSAANLISLTATIIDKDGDSKAASIDLGNAISFKDDAPSLVAGAAGNDSLQVDETNLLVDKTTNFSGLFTPTYGADGAGTVGGYTLGINAGSTGIVDTATNQAVVLTVESGSVVGRAGAGGPIVFTVSVDASGNVTLDQQRAIVHSPNTGPDQETSLSAANLVTLTATVTDKDGDTSSATVNLGNAISFKDDAPSLLAAAAGNDTLQVDETNLSVDKTTNFSGLFTPTYGADGAGSIGGYTLGINAGSTSIVDTATNQAVVLTVESGSVVGRAGAGGPVVFTVSVDASGNVTLDQQRAVVHSPNTGPDQETSLSAANLVTLTATITDKDGDTSTATANLGNAISFKDDAPSLVAGAAGNDSLQVDETNLSVDKTTNFSGLFTPTYGADGAGSVGGYTLGINAGSTGIVDTATNQAVVLTVESGSVVGRAGAGGPIVFTVTVDASGNVTLDQQRAIVHSPNTGPDQETSLSAANLVTLTATVTDKDGDTSSATVNLGNAISFKDDAPSLLAAAAGNDTLQVDETNLLIDKTTNFSGLFTPTYGADGAGTVGGYTLNVSSAGVNSGIIDTATNSHVFLFKEGNNIVGHVGSAAGAVAFVVSVNSTTGEVTLDQQRAVVHSPNTGPDQETSLSAANLISLTATITDKDGDTNTATVNLGNAISFKDDAPSPTVTYAGGTSFDPNNAGYALVDEDSIPTKGANDSKAGDDAGGVSVTGQVVANYGADGAGTMAFNQTSGTLAGVQTVDGHTITLSLSGNVLTGKDSVDNGSVFTLSLDGSGNFTFTLLDAIKHPTANTEDNIKLDFGVTITDKDGDTAPATIKISVDDDMPSAVGGTKTANGGATDSNLLLILDVSGSMADASGVTNMTRLQLEKAAAYELLAQYDALGAEMVRIVTFSDNANAQGSTWTTIAQAYAYVDAMTAGGTTHYNDALNEAKDAFTDSGALGGTAADVAYFLSDGKPNPENQSILVGTREADWQTFLNNNDIDAHAIGLGADTVQSELDPVAYNGQTGTNTNAVLVTDLNQLIPTIIDTIPSGATGNIVSDFGGKFGADGGFVKTITINGTTYTYDPAANAGAGGVTVSGTNHGTFITATNSLSVVTTAGGTFVIDLDDGSYNYQSAGGVKVDYTETIGFSLVDGDGDSSSANLTLDVDAVNFAPTAHADNVITNISGNGAAIALSDMALLWNDEDKNGDSISITGSASTVTSGSASHASGVFTFTDNNSDGGTFNYTLSDGTLTGLGHVVIDRGQANDQTLDGTGLGDILVANNTATTLTGNGGKDVLIGGTAGDTFIGGVGDDLIDMSKGGNDVARITSKLDGNDVISGFQTGNAGSHDQINLDSLFDSYGSLSGTRDSHVSVTQVGGDTHVNIDLDNNVGNGYEMVITLQSVTASNMSRSGTLATMK